MKLNQNKVTYLVICFIILFLSYQNGIPSVLSWDVFGHYIYLPLIFEHKNLILTDFEYLNQIIKEYQNTPYLYQFVENTNGTIMTKYTAGWAVLMTPFYAIAKVITYFTTYKNDGFSLPFQLMISIGGSFYTCLGIYYVQKTLNFLFGKRTAIITLICLVFGTNFLFTNYISIASSNNIEFTLVAAMIWFTIKFHNCTNIKNAIYLGVSLGLIGLTRPPDFILILLPLCWNLNNYGGFKLKIISLWKSNKKELFIISSTITAILFIQAFYWKLLTGNWMTNSYSNNPGEGLDWFTPYIVEVLFSFRKGWFLYTPIMLFATYGLFRWSRENKQHKYIVLVTFLIFLYIISCWTTWWYAESFSQRSLIDIYAIMAIGLAWFVKNKITLKKRTSVIILTILVGLNLFQTYQMHRGIIHASRMTKPYYLSVFGQLSPPSNDQLNLLLIDRMKANTTGVINFDKYNLCYENQIKYDPIIKLDNENKFTPPIDLYQNNLSSKEYFWIITTWKYAGNFKNIEGKIFNACGLYNKKAYQYVGKKIGDNLLHVDTLKKEISFQYLSPEFRTKNDPIRITIWNQSGPNLSIESVKVQCYEPK